MRLYRCTRNSNEWFAFAPKLGWLIFPAEIGGWHRRQPAHFVNLADMRETPIRMGFNTGIPGASMTVASEKLYSQVAAA